MPADIAIVHGWSDSSKSFQNLRAFLAANGRTAQQIWLGDYVSTDDDVRVEDVAKRMHAVLRKAIGKGDLAPTFDLIVHSTGGLVAREWVTRLHETGEPCPAKKIIMLAPANFGSPLAAMGKSMIGRVAKGWNNWFQTGTEMLRGLELASPYQWNLARRDLVDAQGARPGPYGGDKVWPFVIVGARGYPAGLKRIVNEDGSDGTVRAAAANMNAVGMTIDFSIDREKAVVTPWSWRNGADEIPFAIVPDRDHNSIHEPALDTGATAEVRRRLGQLILEALDCKTVDQYRAIARSWREATEKVSDYARDDVRARAFPKNAPKAEAFHQFMQIVVRVRDDHNQPVNDYFVEFFSPGGGKDSDDAEVFFQRQILGDVHVNQQMPSLRCFFANRTGLLAPNGYYDRIPRGRPKQLAISLSAAELGRNVRYFDATAVGAMGTLVVHALDEKTREELGQHRLIRHTTHLVEIVIPRQPVDTVFDLHP